MIQNLHINTDSDNLELPINLHVFGVWEEFGENQADIHTERIEPRFKSGTFVL